MFRLSLLFLLIVVFQIKSVEAGEKVCSVSVKLTSSSDAISKQELKSLKKHIIKKISKVSSLEVVSAKEAEFAIRINLLDTDDLHGPQIKNAMASLSMYTAPDMEMFLYSQHFGRRSKRGSIAWSESNFKRAINSSLQSYVRSCFQIMRLSEE